MTTDTQCAAWKHVKLINANDFSSVPKFFHVKMEVLLAYSHIPKKVGWFGITSLMPHSTIRPHSSHSEPHPQCNKLWFLPLRKPLLEAAEDLAYKLLKT